MKIPKYNLINWKFYRTIIKKDGYRYIICNQNTWAKLEHVLIAERVLGRKLNKNECVHHINGNKSDNRNCNLLICDRSYHMYLHRKMSILYQIEHF